MTARDHNKLLGIFFAIHAALQGLGIILGGLIYGGIGTAMLAGGNRGEEKFIGIFFIFAMVFVFVIGALFLIPQILAALKILKNRQGARFWVIFAAIVVLLSFPFGTALGVYALWFLFGEQGKQFYNQESRANSFAPPPPPNSWK